MDSLARFAASRSASFNRRSYCDTRDAMRSSTRSAASFASRIIDSATAFIAFTSTSCASRHADVDRRTSSNLCSLIARSSSKRFTSSSTRAVAARSRVVDASNAARASSRCRKTTVACAPSSSYLAIVDALRLRSCAKFSSKISICSRKRDDLGVAFAMRSSSLSRARAKALDAPAVALKSSRASSRAVADGSSS